MSGEASDAEIQEFLARAGAREFCARTATNSRAGARPGRGCARERRSARPPQAEETLVRVVPSFQHDVLRFVTGNYGPFEPQEPCEVPLWLACLLRKRKMCTVARPCQHGPGRHPNLGHEGGKTSNAAAFPQALVSFMWQCFQDECAHRRNDLVAA